MKMITAMIHPFLLNKVTSALEGIADFPGMTVTEARGFGHRRSIREQHSLHLDEFSQKIRIEIVTPDRLAQQIVAALVRAARTGNSGDGKVFVWPVESAVRIQTGETDDAAL